LGAGEIITRRSKSLKAQVRGLTPAAASGQQPHWEWRLVEFMANQPDWHAASVADFDSRG